MLIKKIIQTGVDITDPIKFAADPHALINLLAATYEGKCYAGCLVEKVLRVVEESECRINQYGYPNFGTTHVAFEVSATVFSEGEIINGCIVQNRNVSGVMICSHPKAAIIMPVHKNLESIQNGQIISVRVGHARYGIGTNKIAINARPLLPSPKATLFRVPPRAAAETNPATPGPIIERLSKTMTDETANMEALRTKSSKAWDTFDQLLYAYTQLQSKPAGAKAIDISDPAEVLKALTNGSAQYIVRDPRHGLSSPVAYVYESLPEDDNYTLVETATPVNIVASVVGDYTDYIRTIREMIETYNTEELLSNHRNLWLIFKKAKVEGTR